VSGADEGRDGPRPAERPAEDARSSSPEDARPAEAEGADRPARAGRADRPPRRRPGPLRRWLLRPLVWGSLLLLIAVASILLFVQSQFARERAVALARAQLSEYLGREVTIGAVDFTFFPPAVEVRDVVIPGPQPADPPVARFPLVRVQASFRHLRKRIVDLEQIEVIRPQLYLQVNDDGSTNLPEFQGAEGGSPSRAEVRLGHVLVQDGKFRLNDREVAFGFEASGVWGRLIGKGDRQGHGGARLDMLATAQQVTISLPDAHPYAATMSAKASLLPKRRRIEIATARIAGPDLLASASGAVEWPNGHTTIDLPFTAQGSTVLVNRLGYYDEPLRGSFKGSGRFAMKEGSWKYTGEVSVPHLEALRRTFDGVETRFAGDRDLLHVDLRRARHAGGSFEGTVEVTTKERQGPGVPVALDLRYSGVAVETLLADQFPGQALPVVGRLTGQTSGTFRYRFLSNAADAGSGEADVRLAGTTGAGGRGLPLAGSFPVRLKEGVISAQGVELTSPAQTISGASFLYDLRSGKGHVELRLQSADVAPVAALLEEQPRPKEPAFWLPSHGRGSAEVAIAITPSATDTRVILDLADVITPALAADTVRGALTVTDRAVEDLRLEFTRGTGAAAVSGRVPFSVSPQSARPGARPPAIEPLAMAVEASQFPAADLGYFLEIILPPGLAHDVRGDVSGHLDLGGTPDRLSGKLDTEVHDLEVAGLALGLTHAAVRFDGDDVTVEAADARTPAGAIAVRGTLSHRVLDFTADAPVLSLASEPLRGWLGGDWNGRVALAATVSGTLDKPRATVSVRGRNLTFRNGDVDHGEESHLLAEWDGERVSVEGTLLGIATLHGGGRLNRQGAALSVDVASQRVEEMIRLAAGQPIRDLTGSLAGSAALDADFSDRDFRSVVRLAQLQLAYRGHTARNLAPVVVEISPREIDVRSFHLGGSPAAPAAPATQEELVVSGRLGLAEKGGVPLDLKVQSTLSAAWAELFVPKVRMQGALDVLSTVRGTLAAPALSGTAELHDASAFINLRDFPQKLDDLEAFIRFDRDQVRLYRLSARLGNGTLAGNGELQLPSAGNKLAYKLNLNVERLSMVYPAGVRNRGDANLTLLSTEGGRQIRGDVALTQSLYVDDMKVDILSLLQDALRRQRLEVPETDDLLSTTELRIAVRSNPQRNALRVRNNVADLQGDVDLLILGSLAVPTVQGTIELEPGGTLTLFDNKYRVERANLSFNNGRRIDPAIDLVARTDVRSFGITLTIDGTLEKPTTRFSSDSDLADLEILSLIATGSPFDVAAGTTPAPTPSPGQQVAPGQFAQQFLAGQAAGEISKRVGNLFGLDRFRISPILDNGQSLPDVGLTVGKRLSKDVFVTYTTDASGNRRHIVQVEWQLRADLVLVLTEQENGRYAVDAQWEKRF
jgi:hypothetical protein